MHSAYYMILSNVLTQVGTMKLRQCTWEQYGDYVTNIARDSVAGTMLLVSWGEH